MLKAIDYVNIIVNIVFGRYLEGKGSKI